MAGVQGISLVKSLDSPSAMSVRTVNESVEYNGKLYFMNVALASNGVSELWTTDGSGANTVRIKAITGRPDSRLVVYAGKIYFIMARGANPSSGAELWTSDGSPAGTLLVRKFSDFAYDQLTSHTIQLLNNRMYFFAGDSTGNGLFSSDGTAAGTYSVTGKRIFLFSSAVNKLSVFTTMNNRLYFGASDDTALSPDPYGDLWTSDGTAGGTHIVADSLFVSNLISFNGKVFFNSVKGFGVTDGTAAGTQLLDTALNKTYAFNATHQTALASFPLDYTILNNELYFLGVKDSIPGLYATDGTIAGTRLVRDSLWYSVPRDIFSDKVIYLTALNGSIYFSANGTLYRSDGTAAGTLPIIPAGQVAGLGYPIKLTAAYNKIFFRSAYPNTNKIELWSTDGTASGIRHYIYPGATYGTLAGFGRLSGLLAWNNKIYYKNEYDSALNLALYVLDPDATAVSSVAGGGDDVSVYPNPTTGLVQVSLKSGAYDQMTVTDQLGRA